MSVEHDPDHDLPTSGTADELDLPFEPDDIPTIQLSDEHVLPDDEVEALAGERLDHRHYREELLFQDESVRILKPNGEPLAVFLKDVIPQEHVERAYTALRPVAISGGKAKGNRFTASGYDGGEKAKDVLEDGSVSDTRSVPSEISPNTGIAGNYDRYPRVPYCRQTAFNVNNPDKFAEAVPMFQRCDELFAAFVPDRYANQKAKADATVDNWLIPSTAFTTATVNLNWQTATHTDSGDLPEGFGVMSVFSGGSYEGAYYIQPQYQTAFDIRSGDLILSDVHEWHGNGPFHEAGGYYERLSIVMYYRRNMDECGTPEEEVERAKRVGDPGYDQDGDHGGHAPLEPNQRSTEVEGDDD